MAGSRPSGSVEASHGPHFSGRSASPSLKNPARLGLLRPLLSSVSPTEPFARPAPPALDSSRAEVDAPSSNLATAWYGGSLLRSAEVDASNRDLTASRYGLLLRS